MFCFPAILSSTIVSNKGYSFNALARILSKLLTKFHSSSPGSDCNIL